MCCYFQQNLSMSDNGTGMYAVREFNVLFLLASSGGKIKITGGSYYCCSYCMYALC